MREEIEDADEYIKTNHYLPFKVICVGDGNTNKTAFLIALVQGPLDINEYVPTVFDNYSHSYVHHDLRYRINLFDTAGQEEYDRLRPLSYPGTDLVLYVFKKTRRSTLDSVERKWFPEINHHIPGTHSVLIGNTLMRQEEEIPESEIQVNDEDIQNALNVIHAEKYVEFSQQTSEEVLISLIEIIEHSL